MSRPGRRARVGVAVGPDALTGVLLGSAARPERVEIVPAPDGSVGGSVEAAFRVLAGRLESTHGRSLDGARAAVALLPPRADARLLTVPPLRRRELEAVVRRDAARHFMGIDAPRVVGVAPRRRRGGGPAPVLAAAAAAGLLEAVRRAVSGAGWRLASVVPAQAAWSAAARRAGGDLVVAVEGGTVHVARLDGGRPVSLRRVPLDMPHEVVAAVAGGGGETVVLGGEPDVRSVVRAVETAGRTVPEPRGGRPGAAEAAARHAGEADLELVPPSLAAERSDRARGRAWRMAGLAAVLVMAAGLVHLWGAGRELEAIRAERVSIRDEVAPLVAARDSLASLNERMAAIDDVTGRAPRWTRVLYELAVLLPPDAHLTSLVASGDEVEIEAEAGRAGAAIEALRGAESLREVELLGLVERELEEGETVVERFRLGAVLAPRDASDGAG